MSNKLTSNQLTQKINASIIRQTKTDSNGYVMQSGQYVQSAKGGRNFRRNMSVCDSFLNTLRKDINFANNTDLTVIDIASTIQAMDKIEKVFTSKLRTKDKVKTLHTLTDSERITLINSLSTRIKKAFAPLINESEETLKAITLSNVNMLSILKTIAQTAIGNTKIVKVVTPVATATPEVTPKNAPKQRKGKKADKQPQPQA